MSIAKEYGKLTADEFRRYVQRLPEVRKGLQECRENAARLTEKEFTESFGRDGGWAEVYELSFVQHMGLIFLALDGGSEYLSALARDPNPQARLLEDMQSDKFDFDLDNYKGGYQAFFKAEDLYGLFMSFQRTVLSVLLYQRSMSGLIQEVREADDLGALFNAVRVDRSAVACPTIAARIARAEGRSDKHFFLRLRNALKGPQRKHWMAYQDLRYSLFMLREMGFDKLSDNDLERLLVHTLKVYPDVPGARKNLRRQYQLSKNIKTI